MAFKRLLILAPVLFATGCSWFSWLPFVGGDKDDEKSKLKPAELVKFTPEVRIKRVWRSGVGKGLGRKYLKLTPAILADRIIAADAYGQVVAFDRFKGKPLWRTRIGKADGGFRVLDRTDPSFVTGGVGAGNGLVLLGTTRGEVIALDAADGTERWRSDVGTEVLSAPAAGNELVFAQTIEGSLLALEQDTGALRWQFDNQVPILTLRGTAAPVFANGVVYAGFATGKVVALRSDNGEPLWEDRVMLPEGRSELDRMVDVDSTPLVAGPLLFAAAFQGRIKAINRQTGQPVWEQAASSYVDLTEGYGNVYLVDELSTVRAFDQESSELVWRQEALHRRGLGAPLAYSNYLLVGDQDGYLHVLAQSDGRFLARTKLDGDGLRSNLIEADGIIYVLGNGGSLTALEIEVL